MLSRGIRIFSALLFEDGVGRRGLFCRRCINDHDGTLPFEQFTIEPDIVSGHTHVQLLFSNFAQFASGNCSTEAKRSSRAQASAFAGSSSTAFSTLARAPGRSKRAC